MRQAITCLSLCFAVSTASGADTLVYQPATGNYVLTYDCGPSDGGIVSTVLEPANKVVPAISSYFQAASGGGFTYRYDITLGASGAQPLKAFALEPLQEVSGIASPPPNVNGVSADGIKRYVEQTSSGAPTGWRASQFSKPSGHRVTWSRRDSAFGPGAAQGGFTFASAHLPGVVIAQFRGVSGPWSFPCESPGASSGVASALENLRKNDYVPRFAAGPVILVVADPYDSVGVLRALMVHTQQIQQWGLFDSQLSAQIIDYMNQAVAKLQNNDAMGSLVPLGQLRATLRTKFPAMDSGTVGSAIPTTPISLAPVDDLVKNVASYDRMLAARVIDFDTHDVMNHIDGVQ